MKYSNYKQQGQHFRSHFCPEDAVALSSGLSRCSQFWEMIKDPVDPISDNMVGDLPQKPRGQGSQARAAVPRDQNPLEVLLFSSQLQLSPEFRCEDIMSAWTLLEEFNLILGSGIHFSRAPLQGTASPTPPMWRRLMVGHSSPPALWLYAQRHQRSWGGGCCPSSVLRNYQQNLGSAEEGKQPQTGCFALTLPRRH